MCMWCVHMCIAVHVQLIAVDVAVPIFHWQHVNHHIFILMGRRIYAQW